MAAIYGDKDGDYGGGWMSDYDTMPLEMTGEIGNKLALESGGKFTTYCWIVPCLLYGSREEWDRAIDVLVSAFPPENTPDPKATDMKIFTKVKQEFKDGGNITYRDGSLSTLPYKNAHAREDAPEDVLRDVDCELTQGKLVIHLSHKAILDAVALKRFPKAVAEKYGPVNGRGEGAKVFFEDYNSQCNPDLTFEGLQIYPFTKKIKMHEN